MDRTRALKAVATAVAALSVLLAVVLGVSACGSAEQAASGEGASGTTASSVQAGADAKDAAPGFSATTLDGKTVSLEQYRGKPLILVYMTHT